MRVLKSRLLLTGAGLAGWVALAPLQAQTVDFESSAYTADKSFVDSDGWTKVTDLALAGTDNFKIQAGPGNKWAHCLTASASSIYRTFTDRGATLDLRWRWRATGDSVHLCIGASDNSATAKLSARAFACMDPQGGFEGQGQANTASDETWVKQSWYYMRMIMDPAAGKYTLYIASDSLRADERIAVAASAMNGVGAITRVVLRDENGAGAVDVDDISWETLSTWVGGAGGQGGPGANNADSNWSTAKNWSAGFVPDSLTNVLFDQTSGRNCFLDKHASIKSLSVASAWKGSLNLGVATLDVLDKADLTGGTYGFQPAGLLRMSSPTAQSLIGPEGGKTAPPIRHDGTGTLRLDLRPLFTAGLIQTQGRFDFNGQDLIVIGDLAIRNGQPATIMNLDERSISVGRSAHLEGASKDTLLGLVSSAAAPGGIPKGWSISVTAADTLAARFANIGNSRATLATGYASVSGDAGANSGWVFVAPPVIIAPPKDYAAKPGESAVFGISISSKLPASYQWLRDDKDIAGANDSVYILAGVRLADNGATFSCRISNSAGSVSSAAAKLKVDFPAPTAQPLSQQFVDSLSVRLATEVAGARLLYSLNGSAYAAFPGSIMLKDSATLKAVAVLGADTSLAGSWVYTKQQLPQAAEPVLSPEPISFTDSLAITMSTATPGGIIYYTQDQTDPDSTKTRYASPLILRATTTVRAIAVRSGYRPSVVHTHIYALASKDTLGRPQAVPSGGSFTDSIVVTLTPPVSAPDAAMYYTFGAGGLQKYYGPITLRDSGILKAIAIKGAKLSDTAFYAFTRRLEAPSASPKGRSFPDTLRIALAAKTQGESVYYSWNVDDPASDYKLYPGVPVLLDSSATLRAFAVKDGDTSTILSETYLLVADTPQVSHLGGDYSSGIALELKTSTPRALIYYTLDGSTPGPETGAQPYTGPFALDTTATLKAVAMTGHGPTLQRSALLVENYTFIVPGRRFLGPGQTLNISGNYSLTSTLTGASTVIVDVLKADSLSMLKGFRDIQFAIRLSLPDGATAFPNVVFTAPNGEPRALYNLVSAATSTVDYVADGDTYPINAPGTFFLAIDTLPPQIILSGESFGAEDSTHAVFTVRDNVSNLTLDLERTDIPARDLTAQPIGNPEIVTAVLRNPPGSILPLTIRLTVDDHHQKASFPPEPGAFHFLSQKTSGPVRTPPLFRIGGDAANPWDLIALPLAVDPPLTIAQLRRNNATPGLMAATWDEPTGNYRFLGDNEAMAPAAAIWLSAPSSMASLSFPSLATTPRRETGAYTITLHNGWNQVANPTLATLYWPVTRAFPEVYDLSPVKGLNRYDAAAGKYVHADSLDPWRGYFAYYQGGRDTTITLGFQPVPEPALQARAAKSAAPAAGISMTLNLGAFQSLRLGASSQAQNGIGIEDESRPPSRDVGNGGIWSARDAHRLETDVMHWVPGGLYAWRVIAGPSAHGNVAVNQSGNPAGTRGNPPTEDSAAVGALALPDGYAAWAVSRTRGLRFRLQEGGGIPLQAGMADSLDVYAGPAAELEARLAAIPLTVDAFRLAVSAAPGVFAMHLRLPQAARIHWTLWSLDGRVRETGRLDLSEGIYHLTRGASGPGFTTGMYVLGLEWSAIGTQTDGNPASGMGAGGRLTRKIAIP